MNAKCQKHAMHERPRSSQFKSDYLRQVIGLSSLSLLWLVLKLYYRHRAASLQASGAVLVLRLVLNVVLAKSSGTLGSERRALRTTACTKVVLAQSSDTLGSERESCNLQDIRHRHGRMIFNFQGVARVTPTESYNLQDIRHRRGRMICNL